MKTSLLFHGWPYVAMALFAIGFVIRYGILRTQREVRAKRGKLSRSDRLWRVGLVLLLAGHLGGLLFPREVLYWNGVPFRLYVLEATAFASGLLVLGGCLRVMWRQFGKSTESVATQLVDAISLSLFFVALLSGLLAAVMYRWGSSWGVMTVTPYVLSIFRGAPVGALVAGMPFLVRLHVISAVTVLPMLPFTSIATAVILSFHRVLDRMGAQVSGRTASPRRTLESLRQKYNPAPWIWPEED